MLEIINRYAHGFVGVPAIQACQKNCLFELLAEQSPLDAEQIVKCLGANSGHLQVALRMIESLHWLSRNELGEYSLTEDAAIHHSIPKDILELYHLPIESYLQGEQEGLLKKWIERSLQRWNVNNLLMADLLDGALVIPILLALHKHNLLIETPGKPLFWSLSSQVQKKR